MIFNEGDMVGPNNQLRIMESHAGAHKGAKYKVRCTICEKDPELYGDAIFELLHSSLTSGRLPCGCAKHKMYSRKQFETVILRSAATRNISFIGFLGDKVVCKSKLLLRCNIDNHEWSTCNIKDFLKGIGCPKCKGEVTRRLSLKDDIIQINSFFETGRYPKGTIFSRSFRSNSQGRKVFWKYKCGKCREICESHLQGLKLGHLGCSCAPKPGYKTRLDGYIYVLKATSINGEEFAGFGISNFPKARMAEHKVNLKKDGFCISDIWSIKVAGTLAITVEKDIKNKFATVRQVTEGFKTEAVDIKEYDNLLKFITSKVSI